MFKFKMSLLLKSVKFRVAIVTLIVASIIAGIICIPKNKAGEITNSVVIKANQSGVTVAGHGITVIQRDTDIKAEGYDNLFCIEQDAFLSYKQYTNPINFANAGGYFTNYNSASWLINNMYIANIKGGNGISDEVAKNVMLINLSNLLTSDSVKAKVSSKYKFDGSNITPQNIYNLKDKRIGGEYNKNAIEAVEQIALWKYTKNAGNSITTAYDNPNQFLENANLSNDEQRALKYLYYSLSIMADSNAGSATSNYIVKYVTLNKSAAKFDENTYQVGPYYIESNGIRLTSYGFGEAANAQYPATVTITKKDGTTETLGKEVLVKNNDGSFFIKLDAYKDNLKKVDLRINSIVGEITTNSHVLDGGSEQNLLTVDKVVTATSLIDSKEIKVTEPETPPEEPEKPVVPEGTYKINLVKVKNDGKTVITESPATFKINGKEVNTEKGILNIADNKKIENDKQVDTYEIAETKAPTNYSAFNGTLKLSVKFKQVDKAYVIDKENTILEGFDNGARVEFSKDNSTITVYVPNDHKTFDLSLRKFISKIDGKDVTPSREPVVNEQSIKNLEETGTASYYHIKDSIGVTVGSEVEYTIRVYNEGEILGFAKTITDYLPDGLTFVRIADSSAKQYTTTAKEGDKSIVLNYNGNTVIKTLRDFIGKKDINVTDQYYQEVKVICKVNNTNKTYITSRAEITNYGYTETNNEGKTVWKEAKAIGDVDRDSVQNTIKDALDLDNWYENAKERTYIDNTGKTVVDTNYFPGVQDDDDFETVEILSGKYNIVIKKVDSSDEKTTLAGAYFGVKGANVNTEVGPTNNDGIVSVVKGVQIVNDKQVDNYTITETKSPVDYHDYNGEIKVKIATKYNGTTFVIDEKNTTVNGKAVKYSLNNDNTTITIIVPNTRKQFDLSLRKFITEVNGKELEKSRVPQVDTTKLASGESTTATYTHPKNPVDVNTTDVVTYSIRVYNEGEIDGYASKVMDDIPDGLEFLPDNEINKQYGWVMYRELKSNENAGKESVKTYNGKTYVVTKNAKEAKLIETTYLNNALIKAFDGKTVDYKDVKVAFKVVEPTTSDRIITNYAQITENKDSKGKTVIDRDSTPNKWNEGEDDQDIDKIKVRYFDLALRKWVTKAIVIENGKESVTETHHGPWDNPEPVVKVDLKNTSLDSVVVKFEYSIRVYNQGEIAGYAKEISDYIPEGLKFVKEDNPQWNEVDGKIVTRALENTLLKPDEYADVKVVLTWINGADNLGTKVNVAEISEDYNEWGTPDIDSVPNNKVPGEDDIDDAPVILTVRTGEPIVYTGIAIAFISIVTLGIVFIKRNVIK